LSQTLNLLFHLGMLAPLPHALEVRLNLAFELQSIATRTRCKWVLNNIASQLYLPMISAIFNNIQHRRLVVASHFLSTFLLGAVTHFLLPTLIARSLNTRLSPSLSFLLITLAARPRTAFEFSAALLPFVTSSSARTAAGGWAGRPPT
jgi:hypothetical protein